MLKWQVSTPSSKSTPKSDDYDISPSMTNENYRFSYDARDIEKIVTSNLNANDEEKTPRGRLIFQLGDSDEDTLVDEQEKQQHNTQFDWLTENFLNSVYLDCSIGKCSHVENALNEVRQWIQTVLDIVLPDGDLISHLKDGVVLLQFIQKIFGDSCYTTLIKKIHFSSKQENLTTFRKVCKKIGLTENQLFDESDLEYVANVVEYSLYEQEWNLRLRKILLAFYWLAKKLKELKKYGRFISGFNFDSFYGLINTEKHENIIFLDEKTLEMLHNPSQYQNCSSLKKHKKVVKFHDHVLLHCCSVENIAKPYFRIVRKDAPPKYNEFLAMKNATSPTQQSSPQRVQFVTFSPRSYLFPEKEEVKDLNNNQVKKTHFFSRSPKPKKASAGKHINKGHNLRLPLTPGGTLDEGYSTASQNGGTPSSLVSPTFSVSIVPSPSSATSQHLSPNIEQSYENVYDIDHSISRTESPYSTLSRYEESINDRDKMNSINTSKISFLGQHKTDRDKMNNISTSATSLLGQHKTDRDNMNNISTSATSLLGQHKTDRDKMNSVSKKEIKELNVLLSMLDEEKIEVSSNTSDDSVVPASPISPTIPELTLSPACTPLSTMPLKIEEDKWKKDSISSYSTGTALTTRRRRSIDLDDIVNELLSVGSDKNKSKEQFYDAEKQFNLIADTTNKEEEVYLKQASCEGLSYASSVYYESSEESGAGDYEIVIEEGHDSGIDDTMPGIMRETDKKSKKKKEKKTKQDKKENKKHKNKLNDKNIDKHKQKEEPRRSESEPRTSRKHDRNGDARSVSVPRNNNYHPSHHVQTNGSRDRHYEEINGRNGRAKERRSEPPMSGKPPLNKEKLEKRRSEPIVTSKSRRENDIGVGMVGEYRRHTDGSSNLKRSKKSEKFVEGPKVVIPQQQPKYNNVQLTPNENVIFQRNNSVHINPSSKEYVWDTADGKHRVYVRSKDEDPGPLPRKEKLEKYDRNVRDMVKGVNTKDQLIEQFGVSPEIIKMLQEEEKFWQKQQELKKWRESHEKQTKYENMKLSPNRERREYTRLKQHQLKSREQQREEEENEMAREAERYMKIRAEQELVLKTSRENLLRDDNEDYKLNKNRSIRDKNKNLSDINTHYQPPHSRHSDFQQPNVSHSIQNPSDIDYQNTLHNRSRVDHNSNTKHRNDGRTRSSDGVGYKYQHSHHSDNSRYNSSGSKPTSPESLRPNKWSGRTSSHESSRNNSMGSKPPSLDITDSGYVHNGHMSNDRRSQTLNVNKTHANKPSTRPACFSDDDEVFYESRRKSNFTHQTDHRGYFSDHESFRDLNSEKTYLARPLIRQRKAQLRCTSCCKMISDERLMYVEGQNFYWHLKCFLCVVCRAYLNDRHAIRVRIVNYELHCRFCFSAQNGEQLSEV